MKEEIKEILKQCDGVVKREIPLLILAPEYTQLLLDYITNLQTIEQQYSAILSENVELEQKYDMALEDNVKESKRRMELQEEKDKYKLRCYKAKKMIFDNYGLLDKYEIEMLEDILDGKSDE